MKLMILRHGHAVAEAPADNLRILSPQGELDVHKVAQENYEAFKDAQCIVHSPYVRAQQTAEITSQYCTAPRKESDLFVPDGRPDHVIAYLNELAEMYASVLIVSHQPLVGTLIDQLGGFEPGRYRMGTSSLACLNCDLIAADCCSLAWIKHP